MQTFFSLPFFGTEPLGDFFHTVIFFSASVYKVRPDSFALQMVLQRPCQSYTIPEVNIVTAINIIE